MNADDIVKALGGRNGMARCPAHDDRTPSLSVNETDDGTVLLKCFAGCSQDEVMGALTRRGLWSGPAESSPAKANRGSHSANRPRLVNKPALHAAPEYWRSRTDLPDNRRKEALDIWQGAHLVDGTIGERYFRNRGITGPIPVSLKYSPALHYSPANIYLPGIVAAVRTDQNIIAIHRTFLTADGEKKAPVNSPKMMLGSLGNGCVRLAKAGTSLGIAEGIEDALSAQEMFDIPCWAALSAGRFGSVWIPPEVIEVQIFGDNDAAGRSAADRAAEVFTRMGKRVALRFPPSRFKDWNDAARAIQREAA